MMAKTRLAVAAACWCLLGAMTARGGTGTFVRGGTPYTIDVWETDDGLPHNSVITLTQTRDGYLWLGTLNGLVRFDGLKFTVFDHGNTPALGHGGIVHLFEDSRRRLWVGTESDGVVLIEDGRLTQTGIGRGSRASRLSAAAENPAGTIWLYTADGWLWRWQDGMTNAFAAGIERPSLTRALARDAEGRLWVGADFLLVALTNGARLQPPLLPAERTVAMTKLDGLLAAPDGGQWRLADNRIQYWQGGRLQRDWPGYPWGQTPVSALALDAEGNLIVGTLGAGLHWFDREGHATSLSTNTGLSHNFVLAIHTDREGTLWIGTDSGGLNRVKRQVFDTLRESRGLVLQSVAEDLEGGLWMGANSGGLALWKTNTLTRFLDSLSVWSVVVDRRGQLWAGTLGAGLFSWQQGAVTRAPGAETLHPVILALHEDRQGQLWAGTPAGLFARQGDGTWRRLGPAEGFPERPVQALASDASGALWVGTQGAGLIRWSGGRVTAFGQAEGRPGDDVSSLLADGEGTLWVGTPGQGLWRLKEGHWTRFTRREGLVSNQIGYLLDDGAGHLWIGSSLGLARAPLQALHDFAEGRTNFIPFRTYGRPDGLPTRECTLGSQPGALRARNGTLWFPTIKGLASVQPSRLQPNPIPPPVVIEEVRVDGQPRFESGPRTPAISEVVLSGGQERLDVAYTSLNLAAPERARFRYRLENHEDEWVEGVNTRVARYPKLPPGRYRFHVTACNEDGVWNESGASLDVLVKPVFWRTHWFLGSVGAGLLALIVGSVHYVSTQRLQRQLERMRQLEAIEKERARIARDIHDQLGASLTQISLLGEMVEGDSHEPAEVQAHGRQITQTARETHRALDEIVWTVNPSNDTLEGLVNYVCKYAQEYFTVAGLRYRLEVPPSLPQVSITPELRHNVFLAAKEAVTNVVRHAQASAAWVRLHLEPRAFVLEIEDNGRGLAGMDTERARTRHGLKNMRKRLEDVGGQFEMTTGREGGLLIRLKAPLNQHPIL